MVTAAISCVDGSDLHSELCNQVIFWVRAETWALSITSCLRICWSAAIGTDYGHADPSTELDALTTLKDGGGISAAQHKKIVENNPRAFYGLA